jgi:DMSO/TMAO reductase YedYZ molybdopterin-dependent catalytic subunit
MNPLTLRIDGSVENPKEYTHDDLTRFPESEQVPDVARFHPTRRGDGVTFDALLRRVRPKPEANYVTLHAGRDDFHVSVPLAPLIDQGIVVYQDNGVPLGPENHGPFRFLVKDPTACATGELDDCANVKYLDRIELTVRKGRDTRPTNEAEHAALHSREAVGGA